MRNSTYIHSHLSTYSLLLWESENLSIPISISHQGSEQLQSHFKAIDCGFKRWAQGASFTEAGTSSPDQQSEGRPPQKEHNSGVVFLTKSLAEGRSNLFFYHFHFCANSVNWVLKLRTDQHQMYDLSPLQELGLYNCREIKDPWLQTDKTNMNKTRLFLTRSRSPPHHV